MCGMQRAGHMAYHLGANSRMQSVRGILIPMISVPSTAATHQLLPAALQLQVQPEDLRLQGSLVLCTQGHTSVTSRGNGSTVHEFIV